MSDGQLWWDGSTLPDDEIAVVLFARTTSSGARVPVLAAVATGSFTALLLPDQFGAFLEQHAAATLVCHDAAELHWLLHGHFQQSDDQQSLERLWAFSAEARLVDIGILDQYTRRRPGLLAARPRNRQRLVKDLAKIELPGRDELEQRVVAAMGGEDAEALGLALQVPQGVWRAFHALMVKATRLDDEVNRIAERAQTLRERPFWNPGGDPERAHELEEQAREFVSVFKTDKEPGATPVPSVTSTVPLVPFGPLGTGVDVQASIAVNRPDRPLLEVNRDQLEEAAVVNRRRFEDACRILWDDRRARGCFRWDDSDPGQHVVRRDAVGRPVVQASNLQQWLRGVSDSLVDEHNLAVALPVTARGEPSFEPADWGVLASCDRGLAAWRDLVRSCRFMQFHERANAGQVQYDVCPVLRVTDPDFAAIRSLGYRVFRPAEGNVFVLVELRHLRLHCFAQFYNQQRPGCPSRLADYFLQMKNPITAVAAELYADDISNGSTDVQGDDWEDRIDDFGKLPEDDETRQYWVHVARVLLDVLPLGLSTALATRVLVSEQGIVLGETVVGRLQSVLARTIAPELEDLAAPENFVRLAGIRGGSLSDAFHRLLSTEAAGTADAAARNAILHAAGQRANRQSPDNSSLDRDAVEAVLTNAARTAAGRLVGPGHDMQVWREGVRLLADEVVKAVTYAFVRGGLAVIAVENNQLTLQVPEYSASEERLATIERFAIAAQRGALGNLAAPVRVRRVRAW